MYNCVLMYLNINVNSDRNMMHTLVGLLVCLGCVLKILYEIFPKVFRNTVDVSTGLILGNSCKCPVFYRQ